MNVLSAAGEIVERIQLPCKRPTSCCFGGDNLQTLFITTASIGLEQRPYTPDRDVSFFHDAYFIHTPSSTEVSIVSFSPHFIFSYLFLSWIRKCGGSSLFCIKQKCDKKNLLSLLFFGCCGGGGWNKIGSEAGP